MTRKSIVTSLFVGAAFAVLPMNIAPGGVTPRQVWCTDADGTCCPELFSVCGLNGQNYTEKYWKAEGKCGN